MLGDENKFRSPAYGPFIHSLAAAYNVWEVLDSTKLTEIHKSFNLSIISSNVRTKIVRQKKKWQNSDS